MRQDRPVVVGVDFLATGDEAIAHALRRGSEDERAVLHFVHALSPSDLSDEFGEAEFDDDEDLVTFARGLVQRRVESVSKARGLAMDLARATMHAQIGKPVLTLLALCERLDAELLIVGTRARRGLDRLVLGSVAEALVRQAPCPVLVVRPSATRKTRTQPA